MQRFNNILFIAARSGVQGTALQRAASLAAADSARLKIVLKNKLLWHSTED